MFKLKLATDPRWVNIVEKNLEEILTDHAYCEQKAASNAISMVILYPEYNELVSCLLDVAQEELDHFKQVHSRIIERGLTFGRPRKDEYVNLLMEFIIKQGSKEQLLVDRLLVAAMIEARSCERFKILSEELEDDDLKKFYKELMISEANHYTLFINFARKLGKGIDVEKRWEEFLEYEGEIMKNFSVKETMHG
ncbi:MAG TPA: tRNA-(ms[2]io[6]A)-hydroxylase [Bacteroidia bacterium]|nr:tRNA-(ms[2]io[6]A)-hydroxylase [Bacteroidia bacterium]HNT81048.1 tRNA-(ms[2]io[6]A)-hydroxylase [Bacteroidia bacterium]